MRTIVIIGAGECGVRAAFALRERGFEGALTLIGEERSLPYERPPLSKARQAAAKPIRAQALYDDAKVDLRLGVSAVGIDRARRTVWLSTGETLAYDALLLAAGARARRFSGFEACLTLRTDRDAQAIFAAFRPGARIGIIGGGFIGLELAATARQAGAEVTVIEAAPRLLARAVPEAVAAVVRQRHAAEGVDIRTGVGVGAADARSVTLADGAKQNSRSFPTEVERKILRKQKAKQGFRGRSQRNLLRLDFDAVIAGVGSVPNVELAQEAGLTVDNGVVVDGDFRTADPHIFAAGDCCNFEWRGARVRLESWRAAQDQGAHAAAAMLGARESYAKAPWFWSDQYDLTLQVAGLFDMDRPALARETGDETTLVFQCDSAGRLAAAAGIGPGNAVAKDIRILEKLIERGAVVDPATLADPSQNLKRLLKTA